MQLYFPTFSTKKHAIGIKLIEVEKVYKLVISLWAKKKIAENESQKKIIHRKQYFHTLYSSEMPFISINDKNTTD